MSASCTQKENAAPETGPDAGAAGQAAGMNGQEIIGRQAAPDAGAAIEILAPAGDEAALRAAVFSGADAVYLGLTSFSARRTAGNFTPQALKGAVGFCHARGVRVYVAVNTLIYPGELDAAAQAVRAVAAAGADAVILQDLAVAALARRIAPGLALHGSTQMSVHTLAGARQLQAMGFSRVILARELSLGEIRTIAAGCGIQLEVFVHGALCMSVSGQCYMSAFLGGRSGNRGSCAGSCRLPFSAAGARDGADCHLSLKDLSVIGRLPELAAAGVCSAKIEGRLRGPEYVAGAVNACLAARAGRGFDEQLLRDTFSRSGFTAAYLDGAIGKEMFGVRTAGDSAASRAALPRLRELYRRERPRVPVQFEARFEPPAGGEAPGRAVLTARDPEGRAARAESAQPVQPARSDPLPGLRRALEKTGGTPFYAGEIAVSGTPGYLPGAAWNELRRAVLERLLALREAPRPLPLAGDPQRPLPPAGRGRAPARLPLWARFAAAEQLPPPGALDGVERLILPLAEAGAVPPALRAKTILELPRAMFGPLEADTARRIAACRGEGFAGFEAGGLAQIALLRAEAPGRPVVGGFGLNVTNQMAAAEYEALGLDAVTLLPELEAAGQSAIGPPAVRIPTGAMVYGHMPLMLTRACPLQNRTDCAHCDRAGLLTDRKGMQFPVRCGLGVRTVYNPVPLYMGDRLEALSVDYGLAYFTIEDAPRAAQVLRRLADGARFDGPFTRGLYFRGTS